MKTPIYARVSAGSFTLVCVDPVTVKDRCQSQAVAWARVATDSSWPTAEIKKRGRNDRNGLGSGVPLSVIKMPNCLTKNCWDE